MLFFGTESFALIAYLSLIMFVFLGTHALEDILDKYTFPAEITYLHGYAKLGLYMLGYSVILLLICQYFHIDISFIIAGIVGLALILLLAVRDVVTNCVCGLSLLFNKPFRAGDTITIDAISGTVTAMSLRYIALDAGGKTVLIPNTYVMQNVVVVEAADKPKRAAVTKRSKK